MTRKTFLLSGIFLSLILLFIATRYYPGGSQADKNSIGYSWPNNYISNLFSDHAVNGAPNAARPWAVAGVLALCTSLAVFFYGFGKKIPSKSASRIIQYAGMLAAAFAALAVTPLHDMMVTLSGTAALLSLFYIAVFLFRSRLRWLKILAVFCLLWFYATNYIYYTSTHIEWLPVMQKILLLLILAFILSLEYFTTPADFQLRKRKG